MEEFMDLYTLQRELKESLLDLFPEKIWVKAEIAQIQVKTGGHCYMELVQSEGGRQKAKARAVIWGSQYPMLSMFFRKATGSSLEAGQQVLLRVQVSYSELYGMSFVVDDINPEFTLGDAERQRQETLSRLEQEGLIHRQRELSLCELPCRLAVVSASDAAGYGDFCRHLLENEYGFRFDVRLFPAQMQGVGAPASICEAIQEVETSQECYDAILILRGGGSVLDLACFDDYGIALSIAQCPIPVFTAIGHDRDYHVADEVAYAFVKTPTALADLFIDILASEDERLSSLGNRLRLAFAAKLSLMEAELDRLEDRIRRSDPRAVLGRGYTLIADAGGKIAKKASSFRKGETVRILFSDGEIRANIEDILLTLDDHE